MNYSMLTPFSGLSLITHLLVIGFASVFGLLFKKKSDTEVKGVLEETQTRMVLKYILSIFILVAVSSLMLLSFVIAVKTGLREGVNEPHMIYVREGLEDAAAIQEADARANNLNDNN